MQGCRAASDATHAWGQRGELAVVSSVDYLCSSCASYPRRSCWIPTSPQLWCVALATTPEQAPHPTGRQQRGCNAAGINCCGGPRRYGQGRRQWLEHPSSITVGGAALMDSVWEAERGLLRTLSQVAQHAMRHFVYQPSSKQTGSCREAS